MDPTTLTQPTITVKYKLGEALERVNFRWNLFLQSPANDRFQNYGNFISAVRDLNALLARSANGRGID